MTDEHFRKISADLERNCPTIAFP